MRFSRADLEAFRDAGVPALVGPGLRLLFVGINPGLWTAATGTHFAHPGNRFYPALEKAGIIARSIDRSGGFTDDDRAHLLERGIGITNLVDRATVRASELSTVELREGARRLEAFVEHHRPRVVAIAGISAFRVAFERPARLGRQPAGMGAASVWVVPNPSGLNAHENVETLARWYRMAAVEAGVVG